MKNVDIAIYNSLKSVANDSVKVGISTGTLQNGGVDLAPFHDWDSKLPPEAIGSRMVPFRLSEVNVYQEQGAVPC